MNDTEISRLARLVSLTTLLQTKRTLTATDLALRFGVSTRTIYRDIKTLESAGVPVMTIDGKGYALLEGYRIPPVMFTQQEALSLLTAEKLASNRTDVKTAELIRAAMDKLRAALKYTDRDHIESMTSRIQVLDVQHGMSGDNTYQALLGAISAHYLVHISYQSADANSVINRIIEPIGLYLSQHWHVVAFCRLRNDFRDFRLDRIKDTMVSSDTFPVRTETLQRYWDQELKRRTKQKVTVIILTEQIPRPLYQQFNDSKLLYGFSDQKKLSKHESEMIFMVGDLHYIARWMLTFAGYVKIIEPVELKHQLKLLAEQAFHAFGYNEG